MLRYSARQRGTPRLASPDSAVVGWQFCQRAKSEERSTPERGTSLIPDSTDSGHRRGLTQAHIAVVLHVILQRQRNTRAALASGESSHC